MSEDLIQLLKDERARTGESLKTVKARLVREGRWPQPAEDAALRGYAALDAATTMAVACVRPDLARHRRDVVAAEADALRPVLVDVIDRLDREYPNEEGH